MDPARCISELLPRLPVNLGMKPTLPGLPREAQPSIAALVLQVQCSGLPVPFGLRTAGPCAGWPLEPARWSTVLRCLGEAFPEPQGSPAVGLLQRCSYRVTMESDLCDSSMALSPPQHTVDSTTAGAAAERLPHILRPSGVAGS